jgi:hypothetical protein
MAATITNSAAAMTPTPAKPHANEVATETRKLAEALSPRVEARIAVT